jgi:hypothetical protein
MMAKYFALVGDLAKSRKQTERPVLAEQIEEVIRLVNDRFAQDFLAPLETTRGLDEVSSLLKEPIHAFDIVRSVNVLLWPATFRFGLGEGTVDVWGNNRRASDMDGPAFHRAADALERGRKSDTIFSVDMYDLPHVTTSLIEASGRLYQAVMRDWTASSARAIRIYRPVDRQAGTLTQERVAAHLGQSQQAVSDAIRRGHLEELTSAEDAIRLALDLKALPLVRNNA